MNILGLAQNALNNKKKGQGALSSNSGNNTANNTGLSDLQAAMRNQAISGKTGGTSAWEQFVSNQQKASSQSTLRQFSAFKPLAQAQADLKKTSAQAQSYLTPFGVEELDDKYQNTVRMLGNIQSKSGSKLNPMQDAYDLTMRYVQYTMASDKLKAGDPKAAGNAAFTKELQDMIHKYQYSGASVEDLAKAREARLKIGRDKQAEADTRLIGEAVKRGASAMNPQDAAMAAQMERMGDIADNVAMNGGAYALSQEDAAAWRSANRSLAGQGIDTTNWTRQQWADYGKSEAARLRNSSLTKEQAEDYLAQQDGAFAFAREHPGESSAYAAAFSRAGDIVKKAGQHGVDSLTEQEQEVYSYAQDYVNSELGGKFVQDMTEEDFARLKDWGSQQAAALRETNGLYVGNRKDAELDAINQYYGQTLEGAKALAAEAEGTEDEQKWKDNLWFVERRAHYDDVASRADFGEISQVNPDYFNANEYAQVNGQPVNRDLLTQTGNPFEYIENTRFNVRLMTDDERAMYNAIVNTEGLVEGGKYLDYLQYQLDQRAAEQTGQAFYNLGQQGFLGAAAASIASVPASLMRGAGYLDVLGQRLANDISGDYKPINTNTAWQLPGVIADQSRQGVQDQVNWTANILGNDVDLFDFFYGTAMSGVDSLAAGATGIGGQLLGLGAAQSAMQEAYSAGANDRQALMTGTVAGIFETIFETISIEKFYDEAKHLGKRDFREHVKNILAQAGINFSEEFNTELANMIAEEKIMGSKAQTVRQRQEYIDLGLSPEEADARIAQEKTLRLLEAGFGGALMGGAFGVVSNVSSDVRTGSLDKKTGAYFDTETSKMLKELGSHLADGEAKGLAAKYDPSKATSKQTGALLRAIFGELPGEMRGTLRAQLGAVLVRSDNRISNEAADALLTMLSGQQLSGKQIDALAQSKAGMQAVYDLMGVDGETGRALDKNRAEDQQAGQNDQGLELDDLPTLPEQPRRDVPEVERVAGDDMLRTEAKTGENAAEDQREPEQPRRDVPPVYAAKDDDMLRTEAKTGENAAEMQREPEQPRRDVPPVYAVKDDDMLKATPKPVMFTGNQQEARRNVEEVERVAGDDMLKAVPGNAENVTGNAENVTGGADQQQTGQPAPLEKRQAIMGFSVDRESGGVVARMEDGSTRDVDSLDVSDEQKTLAQEAAELDEDAQGAMIGGYTGGDATKYARGWKGVYKAAQRGAWRGEAKSIYADDLSEDARQSAYDAGRAAYEKEEAQALADTEKSADDSYKQTGYKFRVLGKGRTSAGGVYLARVRHGLSKTQSVMLQVIEKVAEESGAQVRVYDTLGDENGNYQTGSNIINVALDAEGGMLGRTVTHELFHFIKEWNAEAGKRLQQAAIEALEKAQGYDLDKRREKVGKQYSDAKGQELDADGIDEEIAAEAMLDQIGTEEGVRDVIKTTAKMDAGLLQKIGDWISGTVKKLRAAMESIGRNHAEVRALNGDVAYFEKIAAQFKEAARVAGENYRAAQRAMSQEAAQDADIQTYAADMAQAATNEDAQAARDGLAGMMYARMVQVTGDTNLDYDSFVAALTAFGGGQMNSLNAAMRRAGLPNVPGNLNSVMAYAARQIATGNAMRGADAASAAGQSAEGELEEAASLKSELRAEKEKEEETRREARTILDLIKNDGHEVFGLRVDRPGLKAGAIFSNSHQWMQDYIWGDLPDENDYNSDPNHPYNEEIGAWDDGELPGVSTIRIDADADEEGIKKALELVKTYKAIQYNRVNGENAIYLVGGDWETGGNDRNESIIEDGEVIAAISEAGKPDIRFELRGDTETDTEAEALEDVRDDAELYAQMNMDEDARAALLMLRQLHNLTTRGGENALIQRGAFEKRLSEIVGKIEEQTGTKYGPNKLRNALRKIYGAMEQSDYKLGEILQYTRDLMQEVLEAAPGVLVENDESTKEAMRILKNRPFYLTADQKNEIQGTYGSVADFRRKNFGRLKIRKQDAKTASLSDVWREDLAPLLPGTFSEDTNDLDMPAILDAWLENANTKKFAGEFGRNIGAYSTNLALNAMLDFYDVPGALKTKADIKEGFRERLNQQEMQIQQLKTKAREAVNNAEAEYNERYRQRIERAQQRREQTERKKELRGKISRDVKAINTLNTSMTDTRHVPESMRAAALAAVEPFIKGSGVFSGAAQIRLAHEYELLKERAGEIGGFDEDILASINSLGERLNGRRLSELTEEELQELSDITGNLHKLIVDENTAFLNGRKTTIDALSGQLKEDMRARGNARQGKVAELVRGISLKETTPTYFADRVGGVIRDMIKNLYAGQNTWAFTMKKAKEFLGENGTGITDRKKQSGVYAKYHVNEWINDKNHAKFTTQHGDWIELNRQEAMSLYALWKRETTNKLQNANHLRVGGFMYQKGTKYEGVDTLRPHPLTESDMQMIRSYLTDEQIAFADEMIRYLSEDMAKIGNEVSMRLYGYEKFKEKFYFPYDTDHRYLVGDLTQDGEQVKQPKSAGMTKALMQNAATPITVKDFTEVWASHVNQMALYAGFAEGIDTMSRVFNQRASGELRMDSVTGEEFVVSPESNWIEMERAIGAEGVKYIKTLARDVSGGVRADERSPIGKGLSLFKKGAVVGSLSVVVQQPTAYARAMLMVNPRYLASAVLPQNLAKLPKNIQNMYKYSGVAVIKNMGRFDTGTGRGAVAWLQDTIREDNLGQQLLNGVDKWTGIGAEKADEWTWGILWGAIENETKHTRADLEAGTEEFYQAVAERFEDVCNHTQVYDSVLSKSEWMRSGSTMDKMVTSFMAEPTLSLNMLQDSIVNFRTNGGGRKVARAAGAFLATSLLTALAKSLVTATRRKDDEGRTWLEKYLAESAGNFLDDVSPYGLVSMIPWARDVVSLFEGYSVERSDMDAVEQIVNAWKTLNNDNKSFEDKMQAACGAVGNLFGIPVKNVWRDTEAIARNLFGGASANEATTWRDIQYSIMDETGLAIPFTGNGFGAWDSKRAAYYDRMADAILRGDTDKYAELRGYTEETNQVKADTVTSGIKSALKERVLAGQITPEEAERALVDGLGMEAGKAFNAVDEWSQTREHAGEEGWKYSKYNNFLDKVETGDGLRDEIQRLMDGGTSAETLGQQITTHFKPLYIEAYNRDKTEAARMKAYILNAYVMLGYDHDKKQKDVEKWLK